MSAWPANEERLMEAIRRGEGLDLEFKACRQGLSRDVYESVCAFLNRHGGTILLGVSDTGEVTGIGPDVVAQTKKDFVNTINNPLDGYGKKYGGAAPKLIEGDNFRMVISVPEFGANPAKTVRIVPTPQVTPEVAGEVTGEVAGEVTGEVFQFLRVLAEGARTRSEAQAELGLKGQANFRDRYLVMAMDAGLVEMTIPDKPQSRLQKYRLTAKGRALLATADKDAERKDR